MGTFFASRRNQVIAAVAAVVLLVILLLVAFNLGRGGSTKIGLSAAGAGVAASSSPSASVAPAPSPAAPSPSAAAPTPSAAAPAPQASAAAPGTTSPALTTEGHQLDAPATTLTRANGGGCQLWVDPGYDKVDCNVIQVRGDPLDGAVWYVVEKAQAAPHGLRVYLLSTGTTAENLWHIRLSALDDAGNKYTSISVKKAQVAGDAAPEVVVGFRMAGPAASLVYDIVQLGADRSLTIAATRALSGSASANIDGATIVDYQPYPNASTPDYFIRSVIGYSGGALRLTDVSHAPERGPGDLAPTP